MSVKKSITLELVPCSVCGRTDYAWFSVQPGGLPICNLCESDRESPALRGDSHWLQAHAELVHVHQVKSGGYGTGDDPLANYVAVGVSNGRAPFMYALDRMTEKITRCQSLYQQGRVSELEEEFKDMASLALCAEALRRRNDG